MSSRASQWRVGLLACSAVVLGAPGALSAVERVVADFSHDLGAWQEREFNGRTEYRLVELGGEQVLEARADGSASAKYRELEIDLDETPYLHWRWRIEATLGQDIDELSKSGDDYPARVYVVRRGGLAFWRTRALNYVWSSAQPKGARWPNAYAGDNVQIVAVNSGDRQAGEWVSHSRDLRADWREAFGEDIDSLDGIALMTDADDTGGSARAWYAEIRLSDSPGPEPQR